MTRSLPFVICGLFAGWLVTDPAALLLIVAVLLIGIVLAQKLPD